MKLQRLLVALTVVNVVLLTFSWLSRDGRGAGCRTRTARSLRSKLSMTVVGFGQVSRCFCKRAKGWFALL